MIVVEAIGEWEWTRLWENLEENLFESPIFMQNWEMSVVMEKMRISPPEQSTKCTCIVESCIVFRDRKVPAKFECW